MTPALTQRRALRDFAIGKPHDVQVICWRLRWNLREFGRHGTPIVGQLITEDLDRMAAWSGKEG
jgi:hypothetical protein